MEIVLRIDTALRAAGIPIAGVGDNGNGTYRVDYLPSATPTQIINGALIVQSTPKKTRVPVPLATLRAQIKALSNADQNTLIVAIVADFLQQNPNVGTQLGIAIVGDQDGP